jgi:hypothetical protein
MVKMGFWVLLVGLVVVGAPVQAATRDVKERAAKRACLNGDTAKGVQILTELYISSEDPVYLYNQGRCFEQNNRYEEAIGRFREFLRKTTGSSGADSADAESAKKHIADCEAVLGRKPVATEPGVTPGQSPPPSLPPEPKATQPEPKATQSEPKATPPESGLRKPAAIADASAGSGLRMAGIATASVGAAAIVAGVLFNLKANSTVSDLQKRYDDGSFSSSKDYKTGSQIAYGAGAVCVVAGAVLYYFGASANDVTVTPVAFQGGAAAMLTGAF